MRVGSRGMTFAPPVSAAWRDRSQTPDSGEGSPQAGWLLVNEIVPRLRTALPGAVRCVGAEVQEELLQDGTAIAAKILHSAEAAGKNSAPETSPSDRPPASRAVSGGD